MVYLGPGDYPNAPERPGREGGPQTHYGPGGGDSGLNQYGCTGDAVKINIDANGQPGGEECVDQAEAMRRNRIWIDQNPGIPGEKAMAGGEDEFGAPGGVGGGSPKPGSRPQYGPVPVFDFEPFTWGEQWQAPTLEQAQAEPGYEFAAREGRRAMEQSAAAKGVLGSGGTLKDISAWGNNFGQQNYQNVFNRNLQGYQTRFGAAKDVYDRYYTGQKDKFAPKLFGYQTEAHGADLGFGQDWQNYWKDHLSAQDIFNRPSSY